MGEYTFDWQQCWQCVCRLRHCRGCSSQFKVRRLRGEPREGWTMERYGKGRESMFKRLAVALALLAVLLAPNMVRAQSSADLIFADLDAYWSQQLAERGIPYSSPRFKFVDYYGEELCGFLDAYDVIG